MTAEIIYCRYMQCRLYLCWLIKQLWLGQKPIILKVLVMLMARYTSTKRNFKVNMLLGKIKKPINKKKEKKITVLHSSYMLEWMIFSVCTLRHSSGKRAFPSSLSIEKRWLDWSLIFFPSYFRSSNSCSDGGLIQCKHRKSELTVTVAAGYQISNWIKPENWAFQS